MQLSEEEIRFIFDLQACNLVIIPKGHTASTKGAFSQLFKKKIVELAYIKDEDKFYKLSDKGTALYNLMK